MLECTGKWSSNPGSHSGRGRSWDFGTTAMSSDLFFFLSEGNPLGVFVEQHSTFVVWLTSVGNSKNSLISFDLGGADRSFNIV